MPFYVDQSLTGALGGLCSVIKALAWYHHTDTVLCHFCCNFLRDNTNDNHPENISILMPLLSTLNYMYGTHNQ